MKKNTFILLLVSIIGVAVISSTSCKKDDPAPTQENFVIQVDSIIHPDTIAFGDTLKILFYGLVGPDGCYQFQEWYNEFDVGLIQITTKGVHYFNINCAQGEVYMDGFEYKLIGVPKGDYTIKIVQPDNSTLDSPLNVKE